MNCNTAYSPPKITRLENYTGTEVTAMNDNEIISMLFDRNEAAIGAIAGKYGGSCASIARNILANREDAEQCVNDAYMKVWESIPPERPKIFYAFLAKITRRLAIDRYRLDHASKRGGGETRLILDELEECVSDGKSVEDETERREMTAAVNRFLGGLPARSRVIFTARYCCCESVKSIAARFGIKENSVSVSLTRTREQLREFMKKEGYEL